MNGSYAVQNMLAHSALDLLPEEVLIVSRCGRVLAANRAARRSLPQLADASRQTLALADLCTQNELQLARWLHERARASNMAPGRLEFTGLGGRYTSVEVDAGGLNLPGLPELVVIRFRREAIFVRRILQLHKRIETLNTELTQTRNSTLRLRQLQRGLKSSNRRLRDLVSRDALTGLYNRRRFDSALVEYWLQAQRQQQPLAVVMIDIDAFKAFNDRHGHPAGDRCLKRVAQAIADTVRSEGDLAARYGGEEFVLLLPETRLHGAAYVAERVLAAVRQLAIPHGGLPGIAQVSISAGVAAGLPGQDAPANELLEAADAALYRAKRSGGNRVARATPTRSPAPAHPQHLRIPAVAKPPSHP